MNGRTTTCAVVSPDPDFVEGVRTSEPVQSGDLEVLAVIEAPCAEITDVELDELQSGSPEIVFLDLEPNVPIGLRFAEFLGEAGLGEVLVGAASSLPPEKMREAMHAGLSDVLPKPVPSEEMRRAMEHARRRLPGREGEEETDRGPGEVIVFFSAKGGTGCTTLCTNAAVDVHRATRRETLLLDLDLELGETALQMGVDPEFSVVDLVRNFHRVDSDLLASYIERHESGVDLLSAPREPADLEAVTEDLVERILAFLRRQYEYILVDAPKTFGPATMAALEAADRLVVVTTPDLPSVRNLARCLPLIDRVRDEGPDDSIEMVVNRYEADALISEEQIEEVTGRPVFETVRNDYGAVMKAVNQGEPAVLNGASGFADDVWRMAGRLAGVEVEEEGADRGWLGGLLQSIRNGSGGARERRSETRAHDG